MEIRDRTVLRDDIYPPNDGQKRPAILTCTRYNRLDITSAGFDPLSPFMPVLQALFAGYAFFIQNIRGTYDSEGKQRLDDQTLAIECPGGYDLSGWAADQSWCDRNVSMAGGPYLGLVQWLAAKKNPPHFKAIASQVSRSGILATHRNGTLNMALFAGHPLLDGLELADSLRKRGPRCLPNAQNNGEGVVIS